MRKNARIRRQKYYYYKVRESTMYEWREGHWKFTINGAVVKTLKLDGEEFREEDGTLWMKIKFLPSGSAEMIDNTACNLELYWVMLESMCLQTMSKSIKVFRI